MEDNLLNYVVIPTKEELSENCNINCTFFIKNLKIFKR